MKNLKRILTFMLSVFMILSMVPIGAVIVSAETADDFNIDDFNLDGKGTETEPFLIENVGDWAKFAKKVTGGDTFEGKYLKLTGNLDFSEYTTKYNKSKDAKPTDLVVGGTNSTVNNFKGTLDGDDYTVSNLKIYSSVANRIALFSYTLGATIKNLNISGFKFSSEVATPYIGAIVAFVRPNTSEDEISTTTIENCKVNGLTITHNETTKGGPCIGGFVGYAQSNVVIRDCEIVNLEITNDNYMGNSASTGVGGFVGSFFSGGDAKKRYLSIDRSVVRGNIDFTVSDAAEHMHIGGAVGHWASDSKVTDNYIKNTYVDLDVKLTVNATAGAGKYSGATTETGFCVGGLIGIIGRSRTTDVSIESCLINLNMDITKDSIHTTRLGRVVANMSKNSSAKIKNTYYSTSDIMKIDGVGYYTEKSEGTAVTKLSAPPIKEDSFSISLDGKIGVNFYLKTLADDSVTVAVKSAKVGTPKNRIDTEVMPAMVDGCYKFTGYVAAAEMDEKVTLRPVVTVTDGNTEFDIPLGLIASHSVKDYIKAAGNDPALKDLLNAMDVYGRIAKAYFSGNETEAVTGDVNFDGVAAPTITGSDDDLTFEGISLVLESDTELRFYFQLNNGISLNQVDLNGATPVEKDGWYYVAFSVAAKDLNAVQTVRLGGLSVAASAMSYCKAVTEMENADGALVNVVNALNLYWQAANAYFN